MADRYIGVLPQATYIDDSDLFLLEQGSTSKKLLGSLLRNYIDRNIVTISVETVASTSPAAVKSYNQNTGELVLQLPRGLGIKAVEQQSLVGRNRTYKLIYDDDSYDTFTVLDGRGINSIQLTSGNHTHGTFDTYTVYYNDGTTFDFQVWNGRNGTGAVDSVNGKIGDIELDASDLEVASNGEYFESEPDGGNVQTYLSEWEKADARTLHSLNNFQFAYRVPETETFGAEDILDMALYEKKVYDGTNGGHVWHYVTDAYPSGTSGLFDIPLYDPNDPSSVSEDNPNYGTSCAMAICNILWKLGLTDINNPTASDTDVKGKTRNAEARRRDISLPYYLQQRGWKMIRSIEELEPGDIVFARACLYPDERRYNPSHSFVYVSTGKGYDFGNDAFVSSGGEDDIDWTTGGSLATFGWHPTLFGFTGTTASPNADGDSDWRGYTTERKFSDGTHGLLTELHNPNTLKYVDYITKPENGQLVSKRIDYPIQRTYNLSAHPSIYVIVKIYKSGQIQCRLYGTSDGLTANASFNDGYGYFLFSFADFESTNINLNKIQSPFEGYIQVASNAVALIHTKETSDTHKTNIYMIPMSDISSGTKLAAHWTMQMQ